MTTPRVSKSLRITGMGKFTGRRRKAAVKRVAATGASAAQSRRLVDKVSGLTNKQFKLTPANRKKAIAWVMKETGLNHRESAKVVRLTVEHTRRVGGGFWDWLGKAARSVGQSLISFIPGGGFINEGIDALADKRKYNWKKGAYDSALSALPVPGLAKVAGDFVLDKTGLKKKIIGKGRTRSGVQYAEPEPVRRPKRAPCDAMKRRGALVSQVMRERGLNLGQASRFVKENNIPY